MRYHPECRPWRAPGHRARATVDQMSLSQAERARQNRAFVRELLQEKQPEFAVALAAAVAEIIRECSEPGRAVAGGR